MIYLGFAIYLYGHDLNGKPVFSLRIWGINAPELSDPTGAGKTALAYAEQVCPPGTHVTVMSHGFDKYGGRADCTLTLPDGSDFATLMLDSGNAVPMAGQGVMALTKHRSGLTKRRSAPTSSHFGGA